MLNRSETARLVECRIGNENYCLDMGIQRYERMERNPEREGPLGWLNRQGSRLPVFRLSDPPDIGSECYCADSRRVANLKPPLDRTTIERGKMGGQPRIGSLLRFGENTKTRWIRDVCS